MRYFVVGYFFVTKQGQMVAGMLTMGTEKLLTADEWLDQITNDRKRWNPDTDQLPVLTSFSELSLDAFRKFRETLKEESA